MVLSIISTHTRARFGAGCLSKTPTSFSYTHLDVYKRQEWGHVVLDFTAQGLTTGLIPNGERSFTISLNLDTSTVFTQTVSGDTAGFSLRNNTSVSEYYNDFKKMLGILVCDTVINLSLIHI